MRFSLATLAAFFLLVMLAPAQAAEAGNPPDLSVTIVIVKDKAGTPTINRADGFQVVIQNHSDKPMRLWSEDCAQGHETLSFRILDSAGATSLMHKRSQSPSAWKNKPAKTTTIAPGEKLICTVAPAEFFSGERMWHGAPEPNTGKPFTLTADFEIKASAESKEHNVWTGRISSNPITTHIVDPNLSTPHEYLWEQCPKQALALMQAERTWINKKDAKDECTPLHHAARFGFVEVTQWLLTQGADVNARAYNRFTPLHLTDHPDIVKLLIVHKADVNATHTGGTALEDAASRFAAFAGHPEHAAEREKALKIVKMLREAGADYGILSACSLDDIERVRVLIADKKQAKDKYALRCAATLGRVKIVKLLLDNGADPEADYGGLSISYFAVQHTEILKLLLEAGANPKATVEQYGSTLLHQAVGNVESMKLLIARGLDVNLTDAEGATVLHLACRNGHVQTVEWLLRHRADAKARTKDGWTPMSLAAAEVWPEREEENARLLAVMRALAGAGVELDVFAAISMNDVERVAKILQTEPKAGEARTPDGRPALHRAVTLDRKDIVKRLLDKGSSPDILSREKGTGHEGETALLQAAFWGRLEIGYMLIEHGANVNAKTARGVVPLHEAARMGHVELAQILLKQGADVNARDEAGKTPLDWACSYKVSSRMNKLLRDHGGK